MVIIIMMMMTMMSWSFAQRKVLVYAVSPIIIRLFVVLVCFAVMPVNLYSTFVTFGTDCVNVAYTHH